MRRWLLVAAAVLVAACGSSGPTVYDAGRTQSAMRDAGWTARMTAGMPDTFTAHTPGQSVTSGDLDSVRSLLKT